MDHYTLSEEHLIAGSEYLSSLQTLGLDPEGLVWAWDKSNEEHVLLLFTSFYDTAGPAQLYEMLFMAYERTATPKDISPFIVQARSPDQSLFEQVVRQRSRLVPNPDLTFFLSNGRRVSGIDGVNYTVGGDYMIIGHGVYVMKDALKAKVEAKRRFERFKRNVERS